MKMKEIKLIIIVLVSVCLVFLGLKVIQANTPDVPSDPADDFEPINISMCVEEVDITNPSQPIFRWSIDSSRNPQAKYWVRVYNQPPTKVEQQVTEKEESVTGPTVEFPAGSKVLDSGEVSSANNFYQAPADQLTIDETYWWIIAVKDAHGWTGWTGSESFHLSPLNERPNKPAFLKEVWTHCSFEASPQVAPGIIIFLNWDYSDPDGDPQTAYEIWLDEDLDFSGSRFKHLVEHISLPGPGFTYILNLSDNDENWGYYDVAGVFVSYTQLFWNYNYYWRVRVRDDQNNWSVFSDTKTFTTPLHAYPDPEFFCNGFSDCSTLKASEDEIVTLTDESDWHEFPAGNCFWVLPASVIVEPGYDETSDCEIKVRFTFGADQNIGFIATDGDGNSCSLEKTVNISLPLPKWKEVPPFGWLRNSWSAFRRFFAAVSFLI